MLTRKLELIGLLVLVMVLAASGAGWLTRRSEAGQGEKPKEEAKKTERPAEKAKEDRKATEEDARANRPVKLRDILNARIDRYNGQDDPRISLAEVLDQLQKVVLDKLPGGRDITWDFNERAFKAEQLNDVLRTEVANPNPIPAMQNVTVEAVLNRILARVPVQSGATFLHRNNAIEITTRNAVWSELRLPANKPLVLVNQDFRKAPLEKALQDLSESLGVNIVLDARAADKAKVEVTARLTNVHIETAVRILADMAGLDVVPLGNVLYVTTAENAAKWDETRRKACGDEELPPPMPLEAK